MMGSLKLSHEKMLLFFITISCGTTGFIESKYKVHGVIIWISQHGTTDFWET